MDPQVIPISMTLIDWSTYLTVAQKVLNAPITKAIDKAGLPQNLASFIVSIAEFQGDNNPATILREAGGLLRHGMLGFLVVAETDTILALLEETGLFVTSTELNRSGWRAAIVTGNLDQWRTAIINGYEARDLQLVLNKCMLHFEKVGLRELWALFKKRAEGDVFKLTVK